MGFLLLSKAEGNVGPRSSPAAACSPELPGFADHIQTASGSRLEPASLGSLSAGASSLGKGCRPSHGPTRRPVPMRRCPAQRPRRGDVPSSSPALSKAWTEARSQYCLLRPEGCAFFFGSIISASTVHFPGKAPQEHDRASAALAGNSPWVFGNVWGEKKKKKHTPFFSASVFLSQHTPMVNTTDFISSGKEPRKAP